MEELPMVFEPVTIGIELVVRFVEVPTLPFQVEAEVMRLSASVPVQPGTKVRVLAVLVFIEMVMLVSEVVATATAGPVRAEMEDNPPPTPPQVVV